MISTILGILGMVATTAIVKQIESMYKKDSVAAITAAISEIERGLPTLAREKQAKVLNKLEMLKANSSMQGLSQIVRNRLDSITNRMQKDYDSLSNDIATAENKLTQAKEKAYQSADTGMFDKQGKENIASGARNLATEASNTLQSIVDKKI